MNGRANRRTGAHSDSWWHQLQEVQPPVAGDYKSLDRSAEAVWPAWLIRPFFSVKQPKLLQSFDASSLTSRATNLARAIVVGTTCTTYERFCSLISA
ncbi:MAG: hypothetical protein RIB71_07015 [Imperialibacter sp.]|uniref:hypothetical protein n=1 Tax=Imperialibacter sp. TaxID=2038411 RepID=UPI0032EDEC36